MTTSRFERWLPLAGVLGGLVYAIAGLGAGYFCVLMLLFATAVHRAVRSGERGSSAHASAAFAGGLVAASGVTVMGMFGLATVEAADKHNAQAVVSLGYLQDSTWLLFIAGVAVFYLATGLG